MCRIRGKLHNFTKASYFYTGYIKKKFWYLYGILVAIWTNIILNPHMVPCTHLCFFKRLAIFQPLGLWAWTSNTCITLDLIHLMFIYYNVSIDSKFNIGFTNSPFWLLDSSKPVSLTLLRQSGNWTGLLYQVENVSRCREWLTL